jgi:hypothetical protein
MNTSGGPVDRATLEDLAASSRILADQGVFDAAGHVSLRHPGHPERFLMSRSLAPTWTATPSTRAAGTASSNAICTARFFAPGRT